MNIETKQQQSLEERILERESGKQILRLNDKNMNNLRDVMMKSILEARSPKETVRLLNAAKGLTDALSKKLEDGKPENIELVERVLKAAASLLREQQ
ncbi:MAG: hypothetical protein AAB400_00860 [Patescibacteria group bacterium]